MQIMAIIPARSGSKGLPHKNIRSMAGHPLLAWSIAAAKLSSRIDRVLVSTDSKEYAELARGYGAEVPFLRPAELSTDTSLDIDFLIQALEWLKKHEKYFPDFLIHLRPTNPIRDPQVLDQAIALLASRPDATSVVSVYAADYPPCKYLKMAQDGYLVSYMDGVEINIPRQDCPQAFRSNGYVDVLRAASVWESGSQLGSKILPLTTPDPGDIDVEDDFPRTEAILPGVAPTLKKYLEAVAPIRSERRALTGQIMNIRHVGLVVRDIARCLKFYRDALGLQIRSMQEESGSFLDTVLEGQGIMVKTVKMAAASGETFLELLHFKSPLGTEADIDLSKPYNCFGFTHLAFTVDEVSLVCSAVAGAGGQCLSSPQLSADGTVCVAFCRDLEGNLLELVQKN